MWVGVGLPSPRAAPGSPTEARGEIAGPWDPRSLPQARELPWCSPRGPSLPGHPHRVDEALWNHLVV